MLQKLFTIYAENAKKHCINASSQSNESVNNIIAHQLPKTKCLSRSSSSDIRIRTGILVKNEGPLYVIDSKKQLGLKSYKRKENCL